LKKTLCILICIITILNMEIFRINKSIPKVSANVIIKSDVNCDGMISVGDITRIKKYLFGQKELSNEAQINADMDNNGNIDILDMILIIKSLLDYDEKLATLDITDPEMDEVKHDLTALINQEREKNGTEILKLDPLLSYVADIRASELAVNYQNQRPDEREYTSLLEEYRIFEIYSCQYILKDKTKASDLMDQIESIPNYIKSVYKKIGIGRYKCGTTYWVLFLTS